ncbi:hypothetical protein ACFKHW_39970 (plasmid) [Bradyrhizobium lupini]|uniref:hypothetical protein n=1 Tax=Rhizobium lupini TaxID=136996 RepID=UPI0036726A6A
MNSRLRGPSSDGLRIFKYQALGNSYLVLDPLLNRDLMKSFEKTSGGNALPPARLVRWLCNQTYGVGSNGLLLGPVAIEGAKHFGLHIINSDGSYAEFSGNGIRIFAKYLLDAGYASPNAPTLVQTLLDEPAHEIRLIPIEFEDREHLAIKVALPFQPRFGADAVGANSAGVLRLSDGHSYTVRGLAELGARLTGAADAWISSTLSDVGNPHCTTFVANRDFLPTRQQLTAADDGFRAIAFRPARPDGPTAFRRGANLQWVYVLDRKAVEVVIYERGEGPTSASGSSACAAACAAFLRGLVGPTVDVRMPGGLLRINIRSDAGRIAAVWLVGNANRVFDAHIDAADVAESEGRENLRQTHDRSVSRAYPF